MRILKYRRSLDHKRPFWPGQRSNKGVSRHALISHLKAEETVLEFEVWIFVAVAVAVAVFALTGFASHRRAKTKLLAQQPAAAKPDESRSKISYIPSQVEWSGSSAQALPFKTLTYKQYDCLEDARYGFKIVALTPAERHKQQAHKTRAHGLKTVASLVRHGCLVPDEAGGHVISDLGLQALETCNVRY